MAACHHTRDATQSSITTSPCGRAQRSPRTERADPAAIADAHLVIRQPLDGEVLAELPVGKFAPAQPLLPVAIRFDLIDENRSLLPAVAAEITLPVAFDIEPPDAATTLHRILPDAVCTGLPRHSISRGSPTLTETNRAMGPPQDVVGIEGPVDAVADFVNYRFSPLRTQSA